jgi:rRNA small subunit pseudouridine methyltransferase Nep1
LIPNEIISHPLILSYSKKHNKIPKKMILDSSSHHSAMKNLPEFERRGRPDIVHIFLLSALESIANKKDLLKIIIHTRKNDAIYINPKTRIIRNYPRFIGLIEQLFEKKIIKSEDSTLIELFENKSLEKIIKEEKYDVLVVLSHEGKITKLSKYFKDLKKKEYKDILCIIGGFPHGDFHFDFSKYVSDTISIYNNHLTVWTVTNEIIVNYENIYLF